MPVTMRIMLKFRLGITKYPNEPHKVIKELYKVK